MTAQSKQLVQTRKYNAIFNINNNNINNNKKHNTNKSDCS